MAPLAQVTTQPPRPASPQAQQQTLATGLAIALTTLIVLAVVFQKNRRKKSGGMGGGSRPRDWQMRSNARARQMASTRMGWGFGKSKGQGRVSRRIRQQLENKVGAGTAARLVDYERSRVPGKSENWYWEAAIERLARDHGRR